MSTLTNTRPHPLAAPATPLALWPLPATPGTSRSVHPAALRTHRQRSVIASV